VLGVGLHSVNFRSHARDKQTVLSVKRPHCAVNKSNRLASSAELGRTPLILYYTVAKNKSPNSSAYWGVITSYDFGRYSLVETKLELCDYQTMIESR